MTAITFENSEKEYLGWVENNQHAFVVNSRTEFDPTYVVLHKSNCPSILKYSEMDSNPGGFTERGYIKVCAKTVDELASHFAPLMSSTNPFSNNCGMCKPK